MEYDEYMKKCEEIWGRNEKLIALFKQDISDLSEKTINNHVRCVKFYIDDFLTFREPLSVEEGVDYLNECFDYFVPQKCWWSSPHMIRSVSSSVKKFYHSMYLHHIISKEEYESVRHTIKYCLEDWIQDLMERR